MNRLAAHTRLTETAHRLRQPGQSIADAFELACLRDPERSGLLGTDLDDRAGRGLAPGRGPNGRTDEIGDRVRTHVRAPDGRTDPFKLRTLAEANGCWHERYAAMSLGSRMAGILHWLRKRAERGEPVLFP